MPNTIIHATQRGIFPDSWKVKFEPDPVSKMNGVNEFLAVASKASGDLHMNMLPSTVKASGFFAPLNCFGQQNAINNAAVEIKTAAEKAATAADQTFLVKPVNIPMPQALNSSRLLVVHNDAAAKAAAHLFLAYKTVCLFE